MFHLVLHTSKCCSLFVHLTESYLFFNTMPPRCDCLLFAFLSNGSLAVIPSISDSLSQIIFRLCLTSLRLHTYATSAWLLVFCALEGIFLAAIQQIFFSRSRQYCIYKRRAVSSILLLGSLINKVTLFIRHSPLEWSWGNVCCPVVYIYQKRPIVTSRIFPHNMDMRQVKILKLSTTNVLTVYYILSSRLISLISRTKIFRL